jgi:hypothetical protein
MLHSAWNSIIQGAFDGSTSTTRTSSIWVGESGVFVVLAGGVVAFLLTRGAWRVRRWPKEEGATLERP